MMDRISHIDFIEKASGVLKRQFNINVGMILPSGMVTEFCTGQAVNCAVCAVFRHALRDCVDNYRSWFEAASRSQAPQVVGCHGGLSGAVAPVNVGGQTIAAIFASGFLLEASDRAAVYGKCRKLGLNGSTIAGDLESREPLTERERALILESLALMAQTAGEALDDRTREAHDFSAYAGIGEEFVRARHALSMVASSRYPVLITGKPGSGKTLCTELIQKCGERASAPFLTVSCSISDDAMLMSELCGHLRGAFPGAICDMPGLLDMAEGGTLVIEDIDGASPGVQKYIVRLIEQGEYMPVGGVTARKTDVRILATSRLDREELESVLDAALLHCFDASLIELPSLENHAPDIEFIAQRIASEMQLGALSPEVIAIFCHYSWPGNVRELRSELARISVLRGANTSPDFCISERILAASAARTDEVLQVGEYEFTTLPEWLDHVEAGMIYKMLRSHQFNRTRTAEVLGISRRNLLRKIEKYAIDTPDDDDAPS